MDMQAVPETSSHQSPEKDQLPPSKEAHKRGKMNGSIYMQNRIWIAAAAAKIALSSAPTYREYSYQCMQTKACP